MEFSGRSVLVVEDEAPLREAYARDLAYHGFHVETAADARTAADLINKRTFDLIWIDLSLDGDEAEFEGHRLISTVRELNEGSQVLVVSAHDGIKDVRQALLKKGANDFLSKADIDMFERLKPQIPFIRDLIAASSINDPDDIDSAFKALFPDRRSDIETSRLVSTLATRAQKVNSAILSVFNYLKPVFRLKNSEVTFNIDKDHSFAVADVWSKKYGSGVKIFFGGEKPEGNIIYFRENPIAVSVVTTNKRRNEFMD